MTLRTFHVSPSGNDRNTGSEEAPLQTIQAAAILAQPGEKVLVHRGVYRERIDPPRGGDSEKLRITFEAAPGEEVSIKGSEMLQGWEHLEGAVWKASLPNSFFGQFNPYRDPLRGHWFIDKGRTHHCGAVYLDGHWLTEAATREEVFAPPGANPLWFALVDETKTTFWAQFPGENPNGRVEINVRQSVFYPSKPGRNFITVRGFTLCHAATPWSPPTTEQIGCLGVNWSKGWIIEGNMVSYSTCAGITLGKYHDPLDFPERDIVEGTAGNDTYHGTIERALNANWDFGHVGGHVVTNNTIAHCEQAGIAGSLGAIGSVITGNTIHDIHVRQLFFGYEQAGIKLHGAIDAEISGNRIFRCYRGMWLDWMSQGTRVSSNLFYNNGDEHDLFVEVNHGPFLIDNNLFLSERSLDSWSHGGAYVHNLFAGTFQARSELGRSTPYHQAHSTAVSGLLNHKLGDDRVINNLFFGTGGLTAFDAAVDPVILEENVFFTGAKPSSHDHNPLEVPNPGPTIRVEDLGPEVFVHISAPWADPFTRTMVTTERLGHAKVTGLPYEAPDRSPLRIDRDYFGQPRDPENPFPGPFKRADGAFHVWPRI